MSNEITQRGMAKLREIFEKEHLHQQTATSDAIDGDFRERVNDTLFGRVWCDEALSTGQYLLHSLCLTAALNRPSMFESYFRAAVQNGCSMEVLRATLNQITAYAGFPAGNDAFRIAKRVYSDLDGDTD